MSESSASTSSHQNVLIPHYTPSQLAEINKQLEGADPQSILRWAIDHLNGLYQTTAFGLFVFPQNYPSRGGFDALIGLGWQRLI